MNFKNMKKWCEGYCGRMIPVTQLRPPTGDSAEKMCFDCRCKARGDQDSSS
jgi:hypothetical protein